MSNSVLDKLAKLKQDFVAQLPGRFESLRTQSGRVDPANWSTEECRVLHMMVHALTGSAGTYGLDNLSASARAVEQELNHYLKTDTVPGARAWADIQAQLAEMGQLVHSISELDAADILAPNEKKLLKGASQSPLVFVVEDDEIQAAHFNHFLLEAGYQVSVFNNPDDFRAVCLDDNQARPDAVIMDIVFPEGSDVGTELLNELKLGAEHGIPVVMVSVRDDLQARLSAFRLGACRYLNKPFDTGQLLDILDSITGRQPPEPYRVLLVDDDEQLLAVESAVLEAAGMIVEAISEPLQTLDALKTFNPDVVVLDVYMPGVSGPEIAALLRERDSQLQLPILFLSAETDMTQQLIALNLGGDDFLVKPIQPDHFVSAVSARARRARQNRAIQSRLENTLYEYRREREAMNRHAIVSVADGQGNITDVNDMFCVISGYTRDELIGQNHRVVKSGEHPPEFYKELWKTIASGQTWHGEICNRRKDGGLYWVLSTITPLLDSKGRPYQYISIRTDITLVKEHEAELLESETKFRTLARNIPGMVYRGYSDWSIEYVSGSEELCGYSVDELSSGDINWFSIIHEEDRKTVAEQSSPLTCESQTLIQEYRVTHKDGHILWVSDHKQSVFNEQGMFIGVDGVVFDITERKLADQEIEHHKERLRRGQMYANIGTWEWNIVTGELYWSERIAPLFGYHEGEVETSYENFLAAVHRDDRQAVIDAVNACVEHDTPYEIEHRVVWQDGTERWLLERGAVARDKQGTALQMLGVVQDIDDRKRAELALVESERQLVEAQSLANIGSWRANKVTGELDWSDEIYRIFGYQPGEITPSVEAFFKAVHPEDIEKVRASEKLAEETGKHDVVHRIILPDGSIRYVHELAQAETDEEGKLIHLTGSVQDITSDIEAQQELITARDEAERANSAKSEFLSSMSHELRTPMNAILGFSQLLDYDDELDNKYKDNIKEIIKAGQHLLELINEVLDLSRIEAGRIDLSLEGVNVCSILEACLSIVTPLAEKREIVINHKGDQGIIARADPVRLKQVMINLLSNAIKYNRVSGNVDVLVESRPGNVMRVSIKDTGPGIPAEKLKDLFIPFNRLGAETSSVEGTGIGLTITRRIVELMGGQVGVESKPGAGSTFWFELPVEQDESTQTTKPVNESAGNSKSDKEIAGTTHTVLYIEDNPINLKLVSQLLKTREHIHLLTAHTPALGIELAREQQPELILLDINLPEMSGFEVMEIFKADPGMSSIPVIALTASAMAEDIERGKQAGFIDYMTKPLDVKHFLKTIDQQLYSD